MANHEITISISDKAYDLLNRAKKVYFKMNDSTIIDRWLCEIADTMSTFLFIKNTYHSHGWVQLEYRIKDGGGVETFEELGIPEIPPECEKYLDDGQEMTAEELYKSFEIPEDEETKKRKQMEIEIHKAQEEGKL